MTKRRQAGSHCRRRTGRIALRLAAWPARFARPRCSTIMRAAGRPARRDHPSGDARIARRRWAGGRHGAGRTGGADIPVLGPAERRTGRAIRSRLAQGRHAISLCRAMRAVQDRQADSRRLRKLPNVEVLFGHEVIDVAQTDGSVSGRGARPGRRRDPYRQPISSAPTAAAASCASSAGSRSKASLGPSAFIVLTTPYDFEAERGYCYRSYFADPGAWCNCFKVSADGPPGLWRTVFPATPSNRKTSIMSDAGVQARMQSFFPSPRPYEIVHRNLYVTHQRVADIPQRPRAAGRRCRARQQSDRRHGPQRRHPGRGQSGGQARAGHARRRAGGAARPLQPSAPTVAVEFVQEQSIANKKRLEARDPEARRRNLGELREIAADPARARQFLLRTSMLASQKRAAATTLTLA